jgi:Protein of unknown function (DUF3723)
LFRYVDNAEKQRMWQVVRNYRLLIPTLNTTFKNFNYIALAADALKLLVPERPLKHSLCVYFEGMFTEKGTPYIPIQRAETNAVLHMSQPSDAPLILYKMLWLCALRSGFEAVGKKLRSTPPDQQSTSVSVARYWLASNALALGFSSEKILDLQRQGLNSSNEAQKAPDPPTGCRMTTDDKGYQLGLQQRCGIPFYNSLVVDRLAMFIERLLENPEPSCEITSLFVRRSLFLMMFPDTTLSGEILGLVDNAGPGMPPSGAALHPGGSAVQDIDMGSHEASDEVQDSVTDGVSSVAATPGAQDIDMGSHEASNEVQDSVTDGDTRQDVPPPPHSDQPPDQSFVFIIERPGQDRVQEHVSRSEVASTARALSQSGLTLITEAGKGVLPGDCEFVNPETDGWVRIFAAPEDSIASLLTTLGVSADMGPGNPNVGGSVVQTILPASARVRTTDILQEDHALQEKVSSLDADADTGLKDSSVGESVTQTTLPSSAKIRTIDALPEDAPSSSPNRSGGGSSMRTRSSPKAPPPSRGRSVQREQALQDRGPSPGAVTGTGPGDPTQTMLPSDRTSAKTGATDIQEEDHPPSSERHRSDAGSSMRTRSSPKVPPPGRGQSAQREQALRKRGPNPGADTGSTDTLPEDHVPPSSPNRSGGGMSMRTLSPPKAPTLDLRASRWATADSNVSGSATQTITAKTGATDIQPKGHASSSSPNSSGGRTSMQTPKAPPPDQPTQQEQAPQIASNSPGATTQENASKLDAAEARPRDPNVGGSAKTEATKVLSKDHAPSSRSRGGTSMQMRSPPRHSKRKRALSPGADTERSHGETKNDNMPMLKPSRIRFDRFTPTAWTKLNRRNEMDFK